MKLKKLLGYSFVALGMALMPLKAQKGGSLKLNGKDQSMIISHHDDFNVSSTESFTVTAYIKVRGWVTNARFINKRAQSSSDKSGYELWGASNSNSYLACNTPYNKGGNALSVWSGASGQLDEWVHIGLVVDRANNMMYLYQGGKARKNKSGDAISSWSCTNSIDVVIGAAMNGSGTEPDSYFFNGEIDNLRFWKRALTEAEMQADMSADRADKNALVAEYDFEGISKSGLVKDISESANTHNGQILPLKQALRIEQVRGFAGCRNTDPILKLELNDVATSPKLKALKLSMEGTTDVNDVEKVKVLLTNSNGENQVVGEAAPAEGELLIQLDETKIITSGKNTFSLCYQIKADAKQGNKLDARLIELTTSETTVNLSTVGNPAGDREIILGRTRLFAPGDYNSKNYRIPAIITAKDGSLVAMTDKRKNNEADLPQDIDVVVRRSTDMGLTWSEPVTVAEGKGYGKGYGDAALVMAKDGTLIATFVGGPGLWDGTPTNPNRTYIIKSSDNGVTWSDPKDITDQIYGANCNNEQRKEWGGVFCASGNGLCTREGRIIFVAAAKEGSLNNYLFYSDDKGDTWHVSSKIMDGGDEAKVVELNNGDLLVSVRRRGDRPWVLSKDGGKTWTERGAWSDIKDPACNGDMIYYTSTKDGYERNRLLHSIPYSTSRRDVSVMVSYDEGKTWSTRRQVVAGESAYSSICKLQDGSIGVYVEEKDPTTASGWSLYFMRFSLDWLTKGKDQYHAPNSSVEVLAEPIFTPDPTEKYLDEVEVTITHPTEGVKLYYTLDGTTPTDQSPVYSAPLKLVKNTTIKVYAEKEGAVPSSIVTTLYKVRKSNEYETWDEETYPRKDKSRVVRFLTVEGATVEGAAQEFKTIVAGEEATEQDKIVYNNTADILKATVGDKLTLTPTAHGLSWMHYYVFVDWNQNMEFEADELVSFSQFSEDGNTWLNSAGESVTDGPTPGVLPPFEVPATAKAGKTRVRFKVDWNSKDPNGNTASDNRLSANNGTICDFTIDVVGGQTTAIRTLDTENVKIYVAKDGLHIEGLQTAQLNLYSLTGQLVQTFSVNGSTVQPLNLPKGVYLLKVQSPQGKKVYKLSL